MKKQKERANAQVGGALVATQTEATRSAQPGYQQIELALDVHAGDRIVVRRVDGAKPQPP